MSDIMKGKPMKQQEEKPEVWEQQEGETAKAYHAFAAFRDAGPSRTVEAAYRKTGVKQGSNRSDKVPSHWWDWSTENEWVSRAHAYDAHLELTARNQCEDEHAKEIATYRKRARKTAQDTHDISINLLLKTGQRLLALDPAEIEPHHLPAYLRAAAAVMEASLNAEAEAIGVRALETLLDSNTPGAATT